MALFQLYKEQKIPDSIFKIPNILKQFNVFFIRDVKSKLTNIQYMIITLFEAPLLAGILAFFMKYLEIINLLQIGCLL